MAKMNLDKCTLNQVEQYLRDGLISYEEYEEYYHVWRSNPHLMENHPACHCIKCGRWVDTGTTEHIFLSWDIKTE
jgi:hypothetical protein